MTERDRYEVADDDGKLVFVVDHHKELDSAGLPSEADPPIGGPMPRDLAEAIVAAANAAERRPGGYLDDYVRHTKQAVLSIDRLQGVTPTRTLELFRASPQELRELAGIAESMARSLSAAAVIKTQMSVHFKNVLERLEVEA